MCKHLPRLHKLPSPAPPRRWRTGALQQLPCAPQRPTRARCTREEGRGYRQLPAQPPSRPHAAKPRTRRVVAQQQPPQPHRAPPAASPEPRAPSPGPLPRQRPNRACAHAPLPAVAAAISRPRRLWGRQMVVVVVPCPGSLTARAVPCLQQAGSRALVSSFLCSPSCRLSTCISAELAAVTARCHHSSNSHLGAHQYTKLGLIFPRWTDLYLSLLILPVTMCCAWAWYLKAFLPFLQSPHGAPLSTTSWKGWPRASPVRHGNQGVSLKAWAGACYKCNQHGTIIR